MASQPVDRRLRAIVIVTVTAVVVLVAAAGISRLVHPPGPAPAVEPTPSRGPTAGAASRPCRSGQPGQRTSADVSGTITGGGLAFPATAAWQAGDQVQAVPFGYDVGIETRWLNVDRFLFHAVARVSRADFPGPARAVAQLLMGCVATGHRFAGGAATEQSSGRYDVSGRYGWQVTTRLSPADAAQPADVATIVVVDTGDPDWLAVCLATSPAGDRAGDRLRRSVTASLTWTG